MFAVGTARSYLDGIVQGSLLCPSHDVHASLVLLQKEHHSFRVAVTGSRVHRRRQYLVAKEDRGPIVEQPLHEMVVDVSAVGWRSLQVIL
eukprot:SM000089S23841  [mRNA]  locus=s89:341106:341500:- [translate_table: standard]